MSRGDTLSRDLRGEDLARNEVNSVSRALRFLRYFEDAMQASKASHRVARGWESMGDAWLSPLGGISCRRGEPHC